LPKTIKNVFYDKLTVERMYLAHQRAKKAKNSKLAVMKFELDLETNLANLVKNISENKYKIGKHHDFTIYEPKERLIRALPYRDRVVHQWYVHEFVKPYIAPKFILQTYACLDDRGTHKGINQLQKYMRIMKRHYGNYYILKCDVRKFFYTIDKDILYCIMEKHISDQALLNFTKCLIYDDCSEIGIPIGNYTSQFFANIYLNELDHYIKEEKQIRYYVRYMDDFIILCPTKADAKELLFEIKIFLKEKLKLDLNPKSRYYPSAMGVTFCGDRIFETHRLLKKDSIKKIKRKVNKWNLSYLNGTLSYDHVIACWNSWTAHANHCNSYYFQKKVKNKCLFKEILPKDE